MGKNCNICDGVTIIKPENLSLGSRVSIHPYSYIEATGEIFIDDFVAIASHCVIVSENHETSDKSKLIKLQGVIPKPILIGPDVWLGARATILGGVTIGKGSVIGAGSVVTKEVPDYSVAVGVPCKVIKSR